VSSLAVTLTQEHLIALILIQRNWRTSKVTNYVLRPGNRVDQAPAGFSLRRPGFAYREVHVVVDKVAPGQVSLTVLRLSRQYHSTAAPYRLMCHLGDGQRARLRPVSQRQSLTPSQFLQTKRPRVVPKDTRQKSPNCHISVIFRAQRHLIIEHISEGRHDVLSRIRQAPYNTQR
jgi:hypothetical protein